MNQCYGDQSEFKQEVQDLKDFMAKPNIKFIYSTGKMEGSKMMRSVSPGNAMGGLTVKYDNTNLVNHLPFADKSQPDILKGDERFKTFYQAEQAPAAHR